MYNISYRESELSYKAYIYTKVVIGILNMTNLNNDIIIQYNNKIKPFITTHGKLRLWFHVLLRKYSLKIIAIYKIVLRQHESLHQS